MVATAKESFAPKDAEQIIAAAKPRTTVNRICIKFDSRLAGEFTLTPATVVVTFVCSQAGRSQFTGRQGEQHAAQKWLGLNLGIVFSAPANKSGRS
jgi:hypothetical protein